MSEDCLLLWELPSSPTHTGLGCRVSDSYNQYCDISVYSQSRRICSEASTSMTWQEETKPPRLTQASAKQSLRASPIRFISALILLGLSVLLALSGLEAKEAGGECVAIVQSYPTLCDPMDLSTPGFFVLHYHCKYVILQWEKRHLGLFL